MRQSHCRVTGVDRVEKVVVVKAADRANHRDVEGRADGTGVAVEVGGDARVRASVDGRAGELQVVVAAGGDLLLV